MNITIGGSADVWIHMLENYNLAQVVQCENVEAAPKKQASSDWEIAINDKSIRIKFMLIPCNICTREQGNQIYIFTGTLQNKTLLVSQYHTLED